MEEQTFEQMQVPEHLAAADAGTAAAQGSPQYPSPNPIADDDKAAAAAAAEAERADRLAHETRIADFVAIAQAKAVDISDVDLATITPAQLQQEAQKRLT